MQGGGTTQKAHKLQNTVTHAMGSTAQKARKLQNTVTHAREEYSTKSKTTKHRHTCKGGVQHKKHKLQNTVTHARGEYSAKSTNYKIPSHMQGGSTAQKAQTTKHSHTCKGGVQRIKKHKLQNTVTHARGEYSAKSINYKTQSHMQGGSTAQKA